MATSIHYPSDPNHALFLRDMSETCIAPCHICKMHCSGPTYCCWDCDIFIHKSCVEELPLKTCHPDHPHLLALSITIEVLRDCSADCSGQCSECSLYVYKYVCESCSFGVDVTWKFVVPLDEKATIKHAVHEHPLTPFQFNKPIKVECRACELQISGSMPFYGCLLCSFYLHETCTLFPEEISRHPFHPQHTLTVVVGAVRNCSACGALPASRWAFRFSYVCKECHYSFNLDLGCATLSQPPEDHLPENCGTIEHFSHHHSLACFSVKVDNIMIRCNACNLRISGQVYGCLDLHCLFFLHGSCAEELTQDMLHYLHPEHPLVFKEKPENLVRMFLCGCCSLESYCSMYCCECCNFNLDMACAFSTFSAFKKGTLTEIRVRTAGRFESMSLFYSRRGQQTLDIYCDGCDEALFGLGYSDNRLSSLDRKDLCMVCARLPEELKHPSHRLHPLTFQFKSILSTDDDVCKEIEFCFGCNKCQFFLSVKDASSRPTLEYQPHEHILTLFERLSGPKYCYFCSKKCSVDSYRCLECDFLVHYHCVRNLDLSIKDAGIHFHKLFLLDKYVVEYYDDQNCDACEKTRRPDRGIYHCADCCFYAHIGCVIPWVESEETAPEKLKMLDEEIAGLKTDIEDTEMNIQAMLKKLEESRGRLKKLERERHDVALTLA